MSDDKKSETLYQSESLIILRKLETSTMTWLVPAVDALGNKYWAPYRNLEKASQDYNLFCEILKVKP